MLVVEQDLIRVAAIDNDSISKAVLTLTAANNMLAANNGQMVVFQPTVVNTAAEAPRIPVGSVVFYTAQVMAGDWHAEPTAPQTAPHRQHHKLNHTHTVAKDCA